MVSTFDIVTHHRTHTPALRSVKCITYIPHHLLCCSMTKLAFNLCACTGRPPLVYTIYNEHYIALPGCAGDCCELHEFLVRP